jgi:diacylglycerol kinase (ATP)
MRSLYPASGGADLKRLWRATINSWNGLVAATQTEQAFREELVLLALGVPLAFFLTADAGWRFALIGSLVFLLIVELLNTAIEELSDRVNLEHDPAIKRVKDMGSAAILLALFIAGALWLWVAFVWVWR